MSAIARSVSSPFFNLFHYVFDKFKSESVQGMNVAEEAIHVRADLPSNENGKFILYWVQSSPRIEYNAALEFSCHLANSQSVPVVCCFWLDDEAFPTPNARHYAFLLQGLQEFQKKLRSSRRIQLFVVNDLESLVAMAEDCRETVVDFGYLREQREQVDEFLKSTKCKVTQVETNAVVPVQVASDKEEFAARTIRPKLMKHLEQFLTKPNEIVPQNSGLKVQVDVDALNIEEDVEAIMDELEIDKTVPICADFVGGHEKAVEMMNDFLENKLTKYDAGRNVPGAELQSNMSPYLNFGHISPVEIIMNVQKSDASASAKKAYVEELLVRRELSINFVYYNMANYDSIKCLPTWAKDTLNKHKSDKRPYTYTSKQLEKGETHDPYWNAAQLDMVHSGKMHGYMRMYWGKKVLEWTKTAEQAYKWLVSINDKYELDGGDPNGYAGVAWIFGKHDRPHAERAIFGTVRYMVDEGLKRKFSGSIDDYVRSCYAMADREWSEPEATKKGTRKRKLAN